MGWVGRWGGENPTAASFDFEKASFFLGSPGSCSMIEPGLERLQTLGMKPGEGHFRAQVSAQCLWETDPGSGLTPRSGAWDLPLKGQGR